MKLQETIDWIMGLAQNLKEGDDRLPHLIETANTISLAQTDLILMSNDKMELEAEVAKCKQYYKYSVADCSIYRAEIKRLKEELINLKQDKF